MSVIPLEQIPWIHEFPYVSVVTKESFAPNLLGEAVPGWIRLNASIPETFSYEYPTVVFLHEYAHCYCYKFPHLMDYQQRFCLDTNTNTLSMPDGLTMMAMGAEEYLEYYALVTGHTLGWRNVFQNLLSEWGYDYIVPYPDYSSLNFPRDENGEQTNSKCFPLPAKEARKIIKGVVNA